MTERIDDLIILGRGVPEQISGGRVTVCTAGYSPSRGFVRLYPTRIDSPLKVWSIVSVEVERNPKDSRLESWKFPDSKSGWENINEHMQVIGEYPKHGRLGLMENIRSKCVADINDARNSLGVIRPVIKRHYLVPNRMHHEAYQPLFEIMEHAQTKTKRDYVAEPRLCYMCGDSCRLKNGHDMQLLDWGCYLWMTKHPGNEQQIWLNMGIGSPDWTHYFLVGNQASHRTSFLVINVIRQKSTMLQVSLFDGRQVA